MEQNKQTTLGDLLTLGWIMGMADSRSFERGAKYQEDGFVQSVVEGLNSVSARVIGSRPYTVRFHIEKGGLESSCTCPWAEEGNFCKHMVAAGLAWLERDSETQVGARFKHAPTGRVGRQADFTRLIEDFRLRHWTKRNLMKLLDMRAWSQV